MLTPAEDEEEEQRWPQADRCHRDVSDAGAAIALQSSVSGGVSRLSDLMSFDGGFAAWH